jgi:putative endonuclease
MGTGSGQSRFASLRPTQWLWKLSDAARQYRQNRILNPDAALGRRGEDLAHRYLQRAGFKVIARNYRPAGGENEVDIIARDGDILVFVEVKSRSSAEYGSPDRAIGLEKQKHITIAARSYATRAGIEWNQVRFDTIAIVFSKPPSVVHQRDVFFDRR